jgi:Tol biopolymer transport system component
MMTKTNLWLGLVLVVATSGCETTQSAANRANYVIGYTDSQCDDPRGQFYNSRTARAMIVRGDGSGRREIGALLVNRSNSWTSFAGWWSDGRQAIVNSVWESEENYLWEREHQTFRMTDGNWLLDGCLVDLTTGATRNLTAIERVSCYNAGVTPWPGDPARATFAPLINGIQHPFVMDSDGRNKKDLSSGKEGFTYGCNVSPDGRHITYNKNYLVYLADNDGSNPRRVDEIPEHTFQFIPTWSPDGKWILFLAGQHYKCHPHLVRADGTGLRKLADRGAYSGSMEPLKTPDFHSSSSDIPVWSPDSKWVYYTAQVGEAVELMRVSLTGEVQQITHSRPGVAHYHPKLSPDGRLVVFGSTRDGAGAQYVADADGSNVKAITTPTPGRVQMHAHWQPGNSK